MAKCKYVEYYPCDREPIDGSEYCEQHSGAKCVVCSEKATHDCSYAGQFICGEPLCENCEGFEEKSKAPGAWGFMNHSHRRKDEE